MRTKLGKEITDNEGHAAKAKKSGDDIIIKYPNASEKLRPKYTGYTW